MVTNVRSLLDRNSAYVLVAISHVQSALNKTFLQLSNQSYFSFLLSSFPVSSPLQASKRLLLSLWSYFLSSFLLRFSCFIFLVLFPLQFFIFICCRSFLAPTILLFFLFCFLFILLFISFFSRVGCRLCKCSVLPWRWRQSVRTYRLDYKALFTIWAPEIFSVCHPPFSFL